MDFDKNMERSITQMQERYQQTLQGAMTTLDKDFLRKMQCGLKCSEDPESSVAEVQRCIERCEAPLSQAHNLMQSELSSFQGRVQQCSTECSNKARDALKADPSEEQVKAAQQQAFKCSQSCVETQLSSGLPALVDRLRGQLQKLRADQMKLTP